jgi:hypothetical protein
MTGLSEYAERNESVPADIDELMIGFKINPDYNPGYALNEQSQAGKFIFATLPEENKYYFKGAVGDPEEVATVAYKVVGTRIRAERLSLNDENFEEYNVLLTEEAFFN